MAREPDATPPDDGERPRSDMVRMPSAWLERLVAGAFIGVTGAAAVISHLELDLPSSLVPAVVVAVLATFAGLFHSRQLAPAELWVRDGSLWIRRGKDLRSIPLRRIAHAERAHRHDGGIALQLRDGDRALLAEISVESAEDAESWLERLGLSLTGRELSAFPTALSVGAVEQRLYAALAIAMSLIASFSVPAAGMLLWEMARHRRIRVGLDGIEEHRFGRRRFHSFSDIENVIHTDVIQLVMKDGKTVTLDLPRHPRSKAQVDDVAATIARARATHGASLGSAVAADRLARKGERVEDWLARLAELERSDAYRQTAPTPERLAQVLEDPQADPTSRTGAAWLLARAGEKEPLRRAQVHAADLKLRVALDAAEEADEAALDEATAELEAVRRHR